MFSCTWRRVKGREAYSDAKRQKRWQRGTEKEKQKGYVKMKEKEKGYTTYTEGNSIYSKRQMGVEKKSILQQIQTNFTENTTWMKCGKEKKGSKTSPENQYVRTAFWHLLDPHSFPSRHEYHRKRHDPMMWERARNSPESGHDSQDRQQIVNQGRHIERGVWNGD